jgi:RNA polymerase sigma-32 factor
LAQNLDVKESEVMEMQQRLAARDLSVDAPIQEGETATMLDTLASAEGTAEDTFGAAETRQLISKKVQEFGATLAGKDRVIFEGRLMAEEPLTLQEIGDRYGISRERVRQIEERIKKKLKAFLLSECKDLEDAVVDIIQ